MAAQITSITFNSGIMTVLFANGQQDDWNLAYVVGPVSIYSVPAPTLPTGEVQRVRAGFEVATARFVYPDEAEPRIFSADVRDIASPTYATAQDLADAITANIPTGGGGGGGGNVDSVTASAPLASSGGANPNLSFVTPGADTQVLINSGGVPGASPDLTSEANLLAVGGASGDGIVELGDASGSGEVSANILNLEGTVSVNMSAGQKALLSTGGQERLAVDSAGALLLATSPGAAGQVPVSAGPGAPVAWEDLLASGIGMNTFFFATINGERGLYIEIDVGDPSNRYWFLNGDSGQFDDVIFGASGSWTINQDSNTVGASTDAVANPTLVTTWTGLATVVVEPVLYGPTVQDALEQLAAQIPPQYLIWEGYISQSSTSDPTVVELTNTLGGSPVLAYLGTGRYSATLTGAFPTGLTSWFSGSADPISGMSKTITIMPVDDDTLEIYSVVGGSPDDGLLSSTYFRITVRAQ